MGLQGLQSSRGWGSGKCTIALRLLTLDPVECIGFYEQQTVIKTGDYFHEGEVAELILEAGVLGLSRGYVSLDVPDLTQPGTCIWLQLDVDTGDLRLRVNDRDYGVVHTLAPDFARPVSPNQINNAIQGIRAMAVSFTNNGTDNGTRDSQLVRSSAQTVD